MGNSRRGEKSPAAKLVINLETGIYYGYTREAAIAHNINKSTLSQYLLGTKRNKTSLRYA